MKEAGFIKATWLELAELLNYCVMPQEVGRTESYWRKSYKEIKEERGPWMPTADIKPETTRPSEFLAALRGERMLLADERRYTTKTIREQARIENLLSLFEREIKSYKAPAPVKTPVFRDAERGVVAMLGDIHYGLAFDNSAGIFNTDIAAKRVLTYAEELNRLAGENTNIAVVLMGDLISGRIHKSIQIENTENVVKQIVGVSELVAEFLRKLQEKYASIEVYSVSGNHSRLEDEALVSPRGEKLDALIPFYCKTKLAQYANIKFMDAMDDSITTFSFNGLQFVAVHGDYDRDINASIQRVSRLIRQPIDYMLSAHMHVPSCRLDDVRQFCNGSVCGSGDEYTVKKRLFAPPTQIALVFDKQKLTSIVPVQLNN